MKMLRKISVLLTITIILSNSVFAQIQKLDEYFQKSLDEWKIPGMAIAIIRNDSVIFAKGYGVKDISKPDKVDENTLFGIASNTKAFTSASIALLVEENKLNFDDKVQKYLPYFELYNDYVSQNFTVTDLLCHRSGLVTFSGDLLWYSTNYNREEIIKRAKYLKPKFDFRTTYGYSNLMFLTAGEIIPKLTNKSWDEFVSERFFVPLNMKNTNSSISKFGTNQNIAQPHDLIDGKIQKLRYISWDNIAPAGAINSSVADMSNWIRMLLNNGKFEGKTIISEESLKKLWSPQTIKELGRFEEKYTPSTHFSTYGLGWELFDYHGRKIVNHSGGLDGMISKVVLVPEEKLGFVILTNSINWLPDALMYKVLDTYLSSENFDWSNLFYKFYTGNKEYEKEEFAKKESERNKNTKPALELEKYCGTYNSILYGDCEVKLEKGKLQIQLLPALDFMSKLEHWQNDTFSVKFDKFPSLPQGSVNFTIDEKSQVTNLKINVPNPDFDFGELEFLKK
jgi:CubicO group peptidase (beta-lactamase class C family)